MNGVPQADPDEPAANDSTENEKNDISQLHSISIARRPGA